MQEITTIGLDLAKSVFQSPIQYVLSDFMLLRGGVSCA